MSSMNESVSDAVFEEEEEGRDSFVQPTKGLRGFALRKRKRRIVATAGKDSDTISVCSLDLDTADQPETKKKKHLSRVTSLASVFSTPLGKMSSALHKSLSSARLSSPAGSMRTPSTASLARSASTVFGPDQKGGGGPPEPPSNSSSSSIRSSSSSISSNGSSSGSCSGRTSPGSLSLQETGWPGSPFRRSSVCLTRKSSASCLTPYRVPAPTPTKSRPTRYWSSVYADQCHKLSQKEIKLQEAVYELYNGEEDLVEDLKLVRKTYADSLIHLNILKPEEEQLVFGQLNQLTPLHSALHAGLKRVQCKDGFWFEIGGVVVKWVKSLEKPYVAYCSNLIQAKEFLDRKRDSDKMFNDFLQRCLESPFSRKLDLWSYLDVPRSRLVKYPLLLKQVVKYSDETDDIKLLESAIKTLEKTIGCVDKAMAEARCSISVSKMEFLSSTLPQAITAAREEIMSGSLRNSRGTKVSIHLFDTVLVVGRSVTRPGIGKIIQVYRDPIPLHCLGCTDLTDGEALKPGSFHRAFSNQNHNRNAFRVYWTTEEEEESSCHTLVAPDEHTKRQWVTTILKAVNSLDRTDRPATSSAAAGGGTPTQSSGTPGSKGEKKNGSVTKASRLNSTPRLITTSRIQLMSRSSTSCSTPRLLSATSLHSPATLNTSTTSLRTGLNTSSSSLRTGLFRKNAKLSPNSRIKQSPLIKSSLSQSAMVKLQSGGVKKLGARSRGPNRQQDENRHRGAIVLDGTVLNRKTKSAVALSHVARKKKPAEKRMLALIDENTRQKTKSWTNLVLSPSNPRYLTRSTGKISKSMNDLLSL